MDQAMYVTVLTDIHSRACDPPDKIMVFRDFAFSSGMLGDTPTRNAVMSRPSKVVPMVISRTCVVNIDAISRIQGTMTDNGW